MPLSSIHMKADRRTQQRAQEHLNYQATNGAKRQRPTGAEDIFAHTPAGIAPAHGQRRSSVNARTLLTAGTFLALLTGGQAAAALADAPFAAAGALTPALNRRARRMLQTPDEATGSNSGPDLGPIAPSTPPSVPVDVVVAVMTGPPPPDSADIVAFMRGASKKDFANLQNGLIHREPRSPWWNAYVPSACADEKARVLAKSAPFGDEDLMFLSRVGTSLEVVALSAKYPAYSDWLATVNGRWPTAPTVSVDGHLFPPPPPPVPVGPPVTLAAAGRPDDDAFLEVAPGGSDLPPQFSANNQTIRLVGYNVATPGDAPCTVSLGNFTSSCETVANNGGNSLRLFGFQTMGGPGRWQGFDNALSTAKAHGLKVVWVLGNQWGDCQNIEPGTAYDGYHNPEWYQTGYKQVGGGNALSYRDFALATVQRYKNNPTIAMWSLLNEAEAGSATPWGTDCSNETLASQAMAGFVADMAGAIRAVDTHHLLTLGTRGQDNNCGLQGNHYLTVQEPLDVLSVHSYAMTYARAKNLTSAARGAGKPLFMSEHGECATSPNCGPSSNATVLERRACNMAKLAVGFAGLGVAGEMPWHLEGPNSTAAGYSIMNNDPLVARLKKFSEGGSFPVDEAC